MPLKKPLGVFDSGVGGLTVVDALLRRYPDERILYVADQAHVPYGGRPLEEVSSFACGISRFLVEQGCRGVIMACNISTATALPSVSKTLAPLPVVGMIHQASRRAVDAAVRAVVGGVGVEEETCPNIGVLATAGTVKTRAYSSAIHHFDPLSSVLEVACPKFVPLIEAGHTQTYEAEQAVREYLTPLAEAECRTIILGCTHYPFLLPTLKRLAMEIFPYSVTFVDPAEELIDLLPALLPDLDVPTPHHPHLLLTTGDAATFRSQVEQFLPPMHCDISSACWTTDNKLILV